MRLSRTPLLAPLFALGALVALSAPAAAKGMDKKTEAALEAVLTGPQRNPQQASRDAYRHPLDTLKFLGLKQNMAVMEISPQGGYWTEILAPLLRDKGRYIAAGPDPEASEYAAKTAAAFNDLLAKFPDQFGKTEVTILNVGTGKTQPVPPGTMDMVLTFRNIHNWMARDQAKAMFDAMYAALKPGGTLGVEEHRGRTDEEQDPKAGKGYVREDFARALIEGSGFKFVAKSEINANPKDTKDYPKGVWTLPPTYAEKDVDRAKYEAIGESDRFLMMFQKPKG